MISPKYVALSSVWFLLVAWSSIAVAQGRPATRLALVVGIDRYEAGFKQLANAKNDARLIGKHLKAVGFTVFESFDVSAEAMKKLFVDFGNRLKFQPPGSVGIVYFAGHGTEKDGVNHLVAVDTRTNLGNSVRLDDLLQVTDGASHLVRVVILDACRSSPDRGEDDKLARGFRAVSVPSGTIIAHSTSPGASALDRVGGERNSPFTLALAMFLTEPGLKIEDVFKLTRMKLAKLTGGRQISWEVSSLVGDLYLRPGSENLDARYQSMRGR